MSLNTLLSNPRNMGGGLWTPAGADVAPNWDEYVASLSPWAWWPLDDGDALVDGDNAIDDASGNSRPGLFVGDEVPSRWQTSLVQGRDYSVKLDSGLAWDIRGASGVNHLGNLIASTGSFTFGWWISGTSATGESNFLKGANFFWVGINFDLGPAFATDVGVISWLCDTGGANANALTADVGWNDGDPHLVLFEYDSSADTFSIWFDGTEAATKSHAGITMPTAHTDANLAASGSSGLDWLLDEYLFFDRVLTSTEHTTLASYAGPGTGPYGANWSPPYNTASHLEIPVPGAASTEAMHPDVVDFGTAWNGYRYWMAMTPYNGDSNTEEPCIVATNDIATDAWEVPTGYTNPIAADPTGTDHYADTDLLYDPDSDLLYVFAVRDDESTFQDIRSWNTDGGGTWSSETTVLSGAAGTYGNPSIIPTASGWRLYYNISDDDVAYRDSSTAPDSGYGAETICTGFDAQFLQNLNVVYDTDGTIVAVVSDAVSAGAGGRLFFYRSTDGGDAFERTGGPVLDASASGWDQSGIYRCSVLTNTAGVVIVNAGEIDVWYSAYTEAGTPDLWGMAHIQVPVNVLRL